MRFGSTRQAATISETACRSPSSLSEAEARQRPCPIPWRTHHKWFALLFVTKRPPRSSASPTRWLAAAYSLRAEGRISTLLSLRQELRPSPCAMG